MQVCVVNTVTHLKNGRGWQVMRRVGSGYNHIFPGILYTLEEAVDVCNGNNYQIVAVGDFWQCLK